MRHLLGFFFEGGYVRYTINGLQQQLLVELGLGAADALILRWYIDFRGSGRMTAETVDGHVYYWVSYARVIEDLPILGIKTTKNIARHLDRMVEAGILRKHVKRKLAGTYSMFAIGENYERLFAPPDNNVPSPPDTDVPSAPDADVPSTQDKNGQPKDSSIIDSSIKKSEESPYQHIIDRYYRLHKDKTGAKPTINAAVGKLVKGVIAKHDQEVILAKLDEFYQSKEWYADTPDIYSFIRHFDKIPLKNRKTVRNRKVCPHCGAVAVTTATFCEECKGYYNGEV